MENEAKRIRKESQNAMQARLKYIWKNMFLTPEQRERINPFLRHKWSIPFWVLYRSGRAVLFKRSVIKTKLEILRKIKQGLLFLNKMVIIQKEQKQYSFMLREVKKMEHYESPKTEMILFGTDDVITSSNMSEGAWED